MTMTLEGSDFPTPVSDTHTHSQVRTTGSQVTGAELRCAYALSLQGLPHRELLPAGLALELLLPIGYPVQRVQVLGQDLLTGEAGLALGTHVVLATATAVCGVTRAKRRRAAQVATHFKTTSVVLPGLRTAHSYNLYEQEWCCP